MQTANTSSLSSTFLQQATEELSRLRSDLDQLDQQIATLTEQRSGVASNVANLQALVEVAEPEASARPQVRLPDANPKQDRNRRLSDADAVVAYIREQGKPIHYREIHRALSLRGHRAGGKDAATTFLARYYDDKRLYRPNRGTYGLKEWEADNVVD